MKPVRVTSRVTSNFRTRGLDGRGLGEWTLPSTESLRALFMLSSYPVDSAVRRLVGDLWTAPLSYPVDSAGAEVDSTVPTRSYPVDSTVETNNLDKYFLE